MFGLRLDTSKFIAFWICVVLGFGSCVVQKRATASDVVTPFLYAPTVGASSEFSSSSVEVLPEEESSSNDPLMSLQQQLDRLEEQTLALKTTLEAEKRRNGRNLDEPFNLKVGGQIRFDGNYISQNKEACRNFGSVSNSVGVNDIRLSFAGKGYGFLQYSLIMRLNSGINFQDAWIRAKDTKLGDLTFGNHFVESGMESIETNSDRAFPNVDEDASFFALRRRLGVSTRVFGNEKRTRMMFGVFLPQSITSSPHRVNLDNTGIVLNTRLTVLPIYNEDEDGFLHELLHIGGSYYWVDPFSNQNLNLSMTGSGWQSGNPKFLKGSVLGVENFMVTNVELGYQYEGCAVTGEGYLMSIDKVGGAYGATVATRCMLTPGCSRVYKRDKGRFGTVKMPEDTLFLDYKNRTVGGNLGAWEALAKWEWTESNKLKYSYNAIYGTVNRFVAVMNWFWNEQTSWTIGWEHAFVEATKSPGTPANGEFDTIMIEGYFKF